MKEVYEPMMIEIDHVSEEDVITASSLVSQDTDNHFACFSLFE